MVKGAWQLVRLKETKECYSIVIEQENLSANDTWLLEGFQNFTGIVPYKNDWENVGFEKELIITNLEAWGISLLYMKALVIEFSLWFTLMVFWGVI